MFNPDMLIIARQIRMLTQVELAEMTGIRQDQISRMETGEEYADDAEIKRLSKALHFPVAHFHRKGRIAQKQPYELFCEHRGK